MTSAKGIRGIEDEIDYLCNYSAALCFLKRCEKITMFDTGWSVLGKNRDLYIFGEEKLRIRLINKENVNKYIQIYVLCDGTNKRFDS